MIRHMEDAELQALCERGQQELMQTEYLQAARTLARAEQQAWELGAFDTLARLYLPLQEARRQIRQRCGEGAVHMHLLATEFADPSGSLNQVSNGQFLIAGWGTIQPAVQLRELAHHQNLYLETFLAAVYPISENQSVVAVIPNADVALPDPKPRSLIQLQSLLPPHHLILHQEELPEDAVIGNSKTYAAVMALWEWLHTPFLNAALEEADPICRMQAYRTTLGVDPACELAHQFLADIARTLARQRRAIACSRGNQLK